MLIDSGIIDSMEDNLKSRPENLMGDLGTCGFSELPIDKKGLKPKSKGGGSSSSGSSCPECLTEPTFLPVISRCR